MDLRGAVPRGQGDCGNPVCEYERSAPRAGVRRPARPGLYADNRAARDGPCPDLYQLAAQGKSDDECWTAMRKRLNVFSTATEGACSVLFTTQGFFKALASTVKDPSKEESILTEHTADPVYAVNIDMSRPADLSDHFLGVHIEMTD